MYKIEDFKLYLNDESVIDDLKKITGINSLKLLIENDIINNTKMTDIEKRYGDLTKNHPENLNHPNKKIFNDIKEKLHPYVTNTSSFDFSGRTAKLISGTDSADKDILKELEIKDQQIEHLLVENKQYYAELMNEIENNSKRRIESLKDNVNINLEKIFEKVINNMEKQEISYNVSKENIFEFTNLINEILDEAGSIDSLGVSYNKFISYIKVGINNIKELHDTREIEANGYMNKLKSIVNENYYYVEKIQNLNQKIDELEDANSKLHKAMSEYQFDQTLDPGNPRKVKHNTNFTKGTDSPNFGKKSDMTFNNSNSIADYTNSSRQIVMISEGTQTWISLDDKFTQIENNFSIDNSKLEITFAEKDNKGTQTLSLNVTMQPDYLESNNNQELLDDLRGSITKLNEKLGNMNVSNMYTLNNLKKQDHLKINENYDNDDMFTIDNTNLSFIGSNRVDEYLKNVDQKKQEFLENHLKEAMNLLHEANKKEINLKKEINSLKKENME